MEIELIHQPGNTAAKIRLAAGEVCTAEAGAMIAMSGHIQVTTTTHKRDSGSVFAAAKRMLAGESLFLNHFEPSHKAGELWLGSALAGDMLVYELDNDNLIVQAGAFVAKEASVDLDLGWQGFRSLLSGESLFWLQMSGRGKVLLSSFGAIYPIDVDGEYLVDTGHIVAFNESLSFSLSKAGRSWWHSWLAGEALVCRFRGKGRVWCQSHHPLSFGRAIPHLKARKA